MHSPILYIHGFASSARTSKVALLRKHFPERKIIAPDLSHRPKADFAALANIVTSELVGTVIGTSLGGYYAYLLAAHYDVKAVFINPSLRPWETLGDKVGTVTNYDTGIQFPWSRQCLEELADLIRQDEDDHHPDPEKLRSLILWANTLTLLGAKDDRIDLNAVQSILKYSHMRIDALSGHRFENFSAYLPHIRSLVESAKVAGEADTIAGELP